MDTNYYLKIAFVILLCLPILYLGSIFVVKLIDNAIAIRKKRSDK